MEVKIKAPRGTQDVLPAESYQWQEIERIVMEEASRSGFAEIRFPTFEDTALFQRSVGDTTDVVQKEMYTFEDKGNRSVTLRPEGTAGTIRAVLENGLLGSALPLRVCYLTSCFRYEKPQAGRLREFHQFGAEMLGSASPVADAEVIAMVQRILTRFGLAGAVRLEINSIGCPKCRADYHAALRSYFAQRRDELCATCQTRLDKNPMRILDCKSPVCSEIAAGAPVGLDYLCDECAAHFDQLQRHLKAFGIGYTVNPRIVRGLDYYTKTVFEFITDTIGAQGTVCGGGRYDGLVQELGGAPTPALGFAMGLERLLLVLRASGYEFQPREVCALYLASMGDQAHLAAAGLADALRRAGVRAECDVMGRSLKAQMKYADKIGARYTVVIGDSELAAGKAAVKEMCSGETADCTLSAEALAAFLNQ